MQDLPCTFSALTHSPLFLGVLLAILREPWAPPSRIQPTRLDGSKLWPVMASTVGSPEYPQQCSKNCGAGLELRAPHMKGCTQASEPAPGLGLLSLFLPILWQ